MSFETFIAQAYFAQHFSNPALTLAELKNLLNQDAVQKHLSEMTLGDVLKAKAALPTAAKDRRPVAEDALDYIKAQPHEYFSAEEIAEAIGGSAPYINKVLKEGFENDTLPLFMTRRRGGRGRGRGTLIFRYLEAADPEA